MLLAIETATRPGTVALVDDRGAEEREIPPDGLAATVAALVPELEALEGFALSIGPGSFTGLRIGLSFLKGLAIVIDRPVVPISTLALVADAMRGPERLVLLDARAGEVYAALYGAPGLEPGLHRLDAVVERLGGRALVAGGDGLSALREVPIAWTLDRDARASAAALGRLALPRLRAGEGVPVDPLEPAYHQVAAVDRARASVGDPRGRG